MANSELTTEGDVVRKRYLRTDRSQPDREWAALELLHTHSPGLTPSLIVREAEPPVVVMSRVEGTPFDEVLDSRQTGAMLAGFDLTAAQLERVDAYRIVLTTFGLLMLLPGNPGHDLNPPGSAERQAAYLLSQPSLQGVTR